MPDPARIRQDNTTEEEGASKLQPGCKGGNSVCFSGCSRRFWVGVPTTYIVFCAALPIKSVGSCQSRRQLPERPIYRSSTRQQLMMWRPALMGEFAVSRNSSTPMGAPCKSDNESVLAALHAPAVRWPARATKMCLLECTGWRCTCRSEPRPAIRGVAREAGARDATRV